MKNIDDWRLELLFNMIFYWSVQETIICTTKKKCKSFCLTIICLYYTWVQQGGDRHMGCLGKAIIRIINNNRTKQAQLFYRTLPMDFIVLKTFTYSVKRYFGTLYFSEWFIFALYTLEHSDILCILIFLGQIKSTVTEKCKSGRFPHELHSRLIGFIGING